mmetsp:Transcript_107685/g.335803  ORF Transcript_107685/g.335803 Transcript_107685/m.335803 type:complete len:263 (+) Transcript_107685:149-937(+)
MAPSAACPMMLHRSSPTSALKNCEDNCAAQSVKLHVAQPLQPPSTPSGGCGGRHGCAVGEPRAGAASAARGGIRRVTGAPRACVLAAVDADVPVGGGRQALGPDGAPCPLGLQAAGGWVASALRCIHLPGRQTGGGGLLGGAVLLLRQLRRGRPVWRQGHGGGLRGCRRRHRRAGAAARGGGRGGGTGLPGGVPAQRREELAGCPGRSGRWEPQALAHRLQRLAAPRVFRPVRGGEVPARQCGLPDLADVFPQHGIAAGAPQ